MDNLTNNQINEVGITLQKIFDIIETFNKNTNKSVDNSKEGEAFSDYTNGDEVTTPIFKLQPSLSDIEKQKRSNFIKQEIKLTAIKGDVIEETMEEFVFVSYKSGDWEEVYKKYITPLHKKYGLNVYCDDAFDGSNENWTIQMQKHITSKKCKLILCFLSKGYLGSYATLLEVMSNRFNEYFAKNSTYKPIIPIILDDHTEWDKELRESSNLVGIPNSGPEYTMFINLLKNFLIVLDFENKGILNMNRAFIKKSISEMILDLNLNATLTQSKVYEFIINTIDLTNNPKYKLYNKSEPEAFFDDLYDNIKAVTNGNTAIFSGVKNPNFNINTFIYEDEKNEYSTLNRIFYYYISNHTEFSFPTEVNDCIIKVIGEGAFERKIIKSILFANDCEIVKIRDDAFCDCKYLQNIKLPESVKILGDSVFKNCINLTDFVLVNNIQEIGEETFIGCSNLENIVISTNLINIPSKTFKDCTALKEIVMSHSVKGMGDRVFSGCLELKKVELSFEIRIIAEYAFENCIALDDVYIPSSVREIRENAFDGCVGLKEIYIHSSVRKIGENAFNGCVNLSIVNGIDLDNFTQGDLELAFGDTLWFKNINMK